MARGDRKPSVKIALMRQSRFLLPILLGLGMAALAESPIEATAIAQQMQASAVPPGMARVWFLAPAGSLNGNVWAAPPESYADGASIGGHPGGNRILPRFTAGEAELYGTALRPSHRQADTLLTRFSRCGIRN